MPYDKKDAAKDTGASMRDVDRAYHDARDDYEEEYGLEDRHSAPWDVGSGHDSGDSGGDSDSGGGGGACYIATVTLQNHREPALAQLREWRTNVLRSSAIGRWLEAYYDKTGPAVAKFVSQHRVFGLTFYLPFVKPAEFALEHLRGKARNVVVYALFLAGLLYGTLVYLVIR